MTGPSQWRKAVVPKHFTVPYPMFVTAAANTPPPPAQIFFLGTQKPRPHPLQLRPWPRAQDMLFCGELPTRTTAQECLVLFMLIIYCSHRFKSLFQLFESLYYTI